jgi:hypothetical protein
LLDCTVSPGLTAGCQGWHRRRAETTTRQGGAAALLPASIQERCRYRGLASALLFLVEAQSPSADRETMAVAMLLSAVLAAGVGPKHNVL